MYPDVVSIPFGSHTPEVIVPHGFADDPFVDDIHPVVGCVEQAKVGIQIGNGSDEGFAWGDDDRSIDSHHKVRQHTVTPKLRAQGLSASVHAAAHPVLQHNGIEEDAAHRSSCFAAHGPAVLAWFPVRQKGVERKQTGCPRRNEHTYTCRCLAVADKKAVHEAETARAGSDAQTDGSIAAEDGLFDDQFVATGGIHADESVLCDAAQERQVAVALAFCTDGVSSNRHVTQEQNGFCAAH